MSAGDRRRREKAENFNGNMNSNMKTKMGIVTGIMLMVAAVAFGQPAWSGGGTVVSTNVSYYVVPPVLGSGPAVQFVNAASDTADGAVSLYEAGTAVAVTAAGAAGTNAILVTSNQTAYAVGSYWSNAVAVIVYGAPRGGTAYQRLTLSTNTANKLTFNETLTYAPASGDQVYRVTVAARLPVGESASVSHTHGDGLYYGQRGKPLLIEAGGVGTNTVRLNCASGVYYK